MDILDQIHIETSSDSTLIQQIKQQVIWLIVSAELHPGDTLPAIRHFARNFSINLHTVRAAYQKLEAEGWVEIRQGLGARVLSVQPEILNGLAKTAQSHTIGVILPSINNPFYHSLLEGIENCLPAEQPLLFVCSTHDDPLQVGRYYAQLAARNVDGILIVSHPLPAEVSAIAGLPLVHVDWPNSPAYCVVMDLENAGYLGAKHLIDHGYRSIGLISYDINTANVKPVVEGYKKAFRNAKLHVDTDLIVNVNGFGLEEGAEGAEKLLLAAQPPKAFFAISDMLAIGAINYLKKKGYQIPGDMGVVGFNDIPLARLIEPALTTINAPAYQMGAAAMQLLQILMEKKLPPLKQIVLDTNLVIRQSCGDHKAYKNESF